MLSVQPIKYAPGQASSIKNTSFKGNENKKPKEDLANNGKFDARQGLKEFGEGILSPITDIFKDTKTFLTTAAVAGTGVYIVNKVRHAGRVLTAAGTLFGLYHLGKSAVEFKKAKDGDDKEKALRSAGAGVGMIGLSVITAKPILKNAKMAEASFVNKAKNSKEMLSAMAEAENAAKAKNAGTSAEEIAAAVKNAKDGVTARYASIADEAGKAAGVEADKVNTLKSYGQSIKELPKSIKNSFNILDKEEGVFGQLVRFMKGKKVAVTEADKADELTKTAAMIEANFYDGDIDKV